ncbi:SDR family NAD(P)-dependent oxidoreductase [Aquisediminimonas sediminicola]|uniref:SDR family NAD(P)-dependent oxidoreductase n=1 Tax=Alteraquisediminimonas sediminicola TaxID=2676787 RepID=UPI001C8D4B68|nr:SDR family NAD(P)-dependent oxidoreductase [Aquisediminimonas sediminicola]
MSGRFARKSVVITGAGSGIGRAVAHLFASEGAHVIAFDRNESVHETAAAHDSIHAVIGDAGSEADVAAMIACATERHGGIDILCANAGISGGMAGLFDQAASDWEAVLRVNLIGAFLAIRFGARAMLDAQRPGAIICTASVAGLRAGAGGPAYSASKAGVVNLVQTAAQQLSGTGIRINAVCPGLIETGMTGALFDSARAKGREDMIGQLNPLRRGGESCEIARAIAFLASDEASYVNGHALVVDGGLSSSLPFAKPRALGESSF